MKTIKIHIETDATDSYLYGGHIFIITSDGRVLVSSLTKLIKKFIGKFDKYFTFLRLLFLRNDFLTNTQGNYFLEIPDYRKTFDKNWKKLSQENNIFIDKKDLYFYEICQLPEMPVYDLRVYAMNLYIATKKGLYEIQIQETDGFKFSYSKINKVFDLKTINISAKAGTIFASGGNEGLYHGHINLSQERLKISELPIRNKSIKSSWSDYDIVNYGDNNSFDYIVNQVNLLNSKSMIKESSLEIRPNNKSIVKVGTSILSMEDLLESSKIHKEDIQYCFNSNSQGFFYLNDGSFFATTILNNGANRDNIHFSSKKRAMPVPKLNNKRPLSSQIIPNGCIIETINSVNLIQNNQAQEIENETVYSVRSYMSSKRYKNLITTVKDNCITIHSVFPFADRAQTINIVNELNNFDES